MTRSDDPRTAPHLTRTAGSSVRRHLVPFVLCLVVGTIVNIAVAWSFSQPPLLRVLRAPYVPQSVPPIEWPRHVPADWPAAPEKARIRRVGSGYREIETSIAVNWHDPDWLGLRVYDLLQTQTGWPFASMERESRRDYILPLNGWPAVDFHTPLPSWRGGLNMGQHDYGGGIVVPRRFPIRPVFPGFALNSLLYSTLAAALWYTPGLIRRIRRIRRNACQSCGYSRAGLAASARCPECGSEGTIRS